jgi:4-hydroxy-tetrahydrodipicolinate synthase
MYAKSSEFTGLGTAMITPFKRDGTVDEEALRRLVDFQIENGVDMLLPCGSTGEAATLSRDEHLDVIRIVIDQANGRAKVVAGAGSNCTREAIDLSMEAADMGADAILSICPYYNKPTQEGIYLHYKSIAEVSGVPVIVYNVPSRTGINIGTETQIKLSEIPNIAGIKEAAADLNQVRNTLAARKKGFVILSGNDDLTYEIMKAGGEGVFSVASNCAPQRVSEMVKACQAGDFDRAEKLSDALMPLFKGLFCESNPIPIKYVMSRMGYGLNNPRLPLTPLSKKGMAVVDPLIDAYGL